MKRTHEELVLKIAPIDQDAVHRPSVFEIGDDIDESIF